MKFAILPRYIILIDGLKLENGILKEVGSNESDVFACLSTISFPWIPI